jgi:hypothetical protein
LPHAVTGRMRATVEWSHELLETAEQEALRSLAVFVGGFDADAAMAVAPGLSVEMLTRLVDKSLVSVAETARGRSRYRLLETVREYEHELLVENDQLRASRERHLCHFAAVAQIERHAWPSLVAERIVMELQSDYENVRAALEWAAASDPCAGMALFDGAWELFFVFGQADGIRLGELLLERCSARDRTWILVQVSVGGLRMMQADTGGAGAVQEEARRSARSLASGRSRAGRCCSRVWLRLSQERWKRGAKRSRRRGTCTGSWAWQAAKARR